MRQNVTRVVLVLLMLGYLGVAAWSHTQGGIDVRLVLATGPIGLAAFLVGYAIDLLIFGVILRSIVRSRRPGAAAAALAQVH